MLKNYWGHTALVTIYVLALYIVAPWGEFPLNDDWVYSLAAIASAKAGMFKFVGCESAWALPHIASGALITRAVGFSHSAMRWVNIFGMGATALVLDAYLKRFKVSPSIRFITVGTFVFNPVAFVLSTSFMTDVLFVALWLSACYSWDMWLGGADRKWVLLAFFATTLAVGDRQFGLLIPVVVTILVLARVYRARVGSSSRRLETRDALSLLASFLVITLAALIWFWFRLLGGYQPVLITVRAVIDVWFLLVLSVGFLSLSVLPLGFLAGRKEIKLSSVRDVSFVLVVFSITISCFGRSSFLFGDYLSPFGLFPANFHLFGERPVIFGATFRCLMMVISFLIVLRGAPLIWSRLVHTLKTHYTLGAANSANGSSPDTMGLVLGGASILFFLLMLVRGAFDRYLLPILPGLLIILAVGVSRTHRRRLIGAYLSLVALVYLSITLSHDYFRWNEAKWMAAEDLVAQGISHQEIHAGYEWQGWFNPKGEYHLQINDARFTHLIAFSDTVPGFSSIRQIPWYSYWAPHQRFIFVLKRNDT